MILAMIGFAIEDAFIKHAAESLPTGQITFIIGSCGGLVFWFFCYLKGVSVLGPALRHPMMVVRIASESLGFTCFVIALALIPLSLASAIIQATPLLIAAGAALFFGEKVGWRRWAAIAVGFLGVLVVLRPGFDGFDPNTLFAIAAMFALSLRDLATHPIPKSTSNLFLSFWGFVSFIPPAIVLTLFQGGPVVPEFAELGTMFLVLVSGIAGYMAITIAIRTGDLSAVAPYRYLRLVFSIGIGAVFFAERPDVFVLLGSAMIVGSGLFAILREARIKGSADKLSSQ